MKNETQLILADTLYGEARGEIKQYGVNSIVAIANVIINRYKHKPQFGSSIQSICLKPYQFSCWNKNDPNLKILSSAERFISKYYKICLDIADSAINNNLQDITNGATHYYSKNIKKIPIWINAMQKCITIGSHIFYKLS